MKKVLITGIAGFAGSHLTDVLMKRKDLEITGLAHPSHPALHGVPDTIPVYHHDLSESKQLSKILQKIQPDALFHLAGMAHVHESWNNREEFIRTNFLGTFHLLEACRSMNSFPRVLVIGSGECYGAVPADEQPIREIRPLSPSSPYAVTKIAQEMMAIQYAKSEKYPVFISRSFNHTGPGQKETFVCSSFARQIALAEAGFAPPEIRVGNLTARRDFSDVRDVVRAYIYIVENGRPGEPYNVCSGKAVSIQDILNILLSESTTPFEVKIDPEKFRPTDIPLLQGDPSKLMNQTGWRPVYTLHQTLRDLLNYWRKKIRL